MKHKMTHKQINQNKIQILSILLVWLGLTLLCWFLPRKEISDSERRKLSQFPEGSWSAIMKGAYMENFEEAATDQFPMREGFRSIRALMDTCVFQKKDVHGIYQAEEQLVEMLYPFNESSVQKAGEKCQRIYDMWLADTDVQVYLAVIPDKGYYLSGTDKQNSATEGASSQEREETLGAGNEYLTLDYERLNTIMQEEFPEAEWISLEDTLSKESYYKTDSHWRQEQLEPAANRILEAMGSEALEGLQKELALEEFFGVYAGQSALPVQGEAMYYLTNETLEQCQVYHVENGNRLGIYDEEQLSGRDPYAFFLSGNTAIAMIENPNATSDRELVIFRDSFGSSIAPLLLQSYSRVILVDTRYVNPELLGDYVEFEDQDVLFLYSALLLNQSETMR